MAIMDKIFGTTKIVKDLQQQVKQLQRANIGFTLNASTAIYPTWQTIQNIDTYTTVDDVYSIISLLAETAARIPMYGYEIISEPAMKSFKK